jgi:hypothetical protein
MPQPVLRPPPRRNQTELTGSPTKPKRQVSCELEPRPIPCRTATNPSSKTQRRTLKITDLLPRQSLLSRDEHPQLHPRELHSEQRLKPFTCSFVQLSQITASLFVGDDWAERHHDVEVMDAGCCQGRLPEGVAGMTRLHTMIAGQVTQGRAADDVEVLVGIETDRDPWMQALVGVAPSPA